jgi:hypothetical protein
MNLQENIHRIKEVMGLIVELSDGAINKAVEKLSTQTTINPNIIRSYIIRFERIKNTLDKKDIFQYTWDELESVVDSNVDKTALKVKAGKVDLNDITNTELIYNGKHGVKIFVGTTRESCVKYGNGYSFCISARGEDDRDFTDTMYHEYRIESNGTPYFVFNQSRSTDIVDNKFVDPFHLIVIIVYKKSDDPDKINYTITSANNDDDKRYNTFLDIERDFSELSGLGHLFKPVDVVPKEKELSTFEKTYADKLKEYRHAVMRILGYGQDEMYRGKKVHGRLENDNIWNHELIEKLVTYSINKIDRDKIKKILKGELIPMKMYYSTKNPGPGDGEHNVPQWDDFRYASNDEDNVDFLTPQQFEEYKKDPNAFCEKYKQERNKEFENNTWWLRHPNTYGAMGKDGQTTDGWDYEELAERGEGSKFKMLALYPIKVNPVVMDLLKYSLEVYSEYRDKKMELHNMK